MANRKPVRLIDDRILVGRLFTQRGRQQCTRAIKPFFCNGNNNKKKKK